MRFVYASNPDHQKPKSSPLNVTRADIKVINTVLYKSGCMVSMELHYDVTLISLLPAFTYIKDEVVGGCRSVKWQCRFMWEADYVSDTLLYRKTY